jgi:hypothetical protein
MEEHARLVAQDTLAPLDPAAVLGANTVLVAAADYRIPVFWLFCYAGDNITRYRLRNNELIGLVSEMKEVKSRLAERDRLARETFPAYTDVWARWRETFASVECAFLGLDAHGIWDVYASNEAFARDLCAALRWFDSTAGEDLEVLLHLAGINAYDHAARTFTPEENPILVGSDETAADYLVGRLFPG